MFLNYGAEEDSFERSLDSKVIKPVNPKGNQSWIFIERADAEVEAPIVWPPDMKSWERWQAGEEADNRRWDGWMAPPAQWTWVWANSWKQWRTEKPGMLQFMGLQSVGHTLVTELQRIRAHWGSSWFWYHEGPCGGPGHKACVSRISLPSWSSLSSNQQIDVAVN